MNKNKTVPVSAPIEGVCNSQVDACVLVNGNPVKEYLHNGNKYIEAKSGSTFSIRLKNNGCSRVMAIVSVDGIDVITGEKASETKTGYVLSPYSSTEIKGYRIDSNSEASFKFTEVGKGEGYAEIKGDASNVGSIGVRFFGEKQDEYESFNEFFNKFPKTKPYTPIPRPIPINPWPPMYPSTPFPYDTTWRMTCNVTDGPINSQNLNYMKELDFSDGFDLTTKWGNKIDSKITTTEFKIGKQMGTYVFLYASKNNLKKMGIQFEKVIEIRIPDPFDKNMKFCTPPPNWKG